MKRKIILSLTLLFLGISVNAADWNTLGKDSLITAYQDSLAMLVQQYYQPSGLDEDYVPNPYYYKLFTHPTYYTSAIRSHFGLYTPTDATDAVINQTLLSCYLKHPELFELTEDELNKVRQPQNKTVKSEAPEIKVLDLVRMEKPKAEVGIVDPIAERPNFWKHKANVYFQFSQSYISDNWYKGGESSNTLLTGLLLEANYDDQKRLEWENKLEIKVGFLSSKGDTLHKFKTNTDLFRVTSKLGYKAVKNWYYTVMAQMDNQFFPGYKTNDKNLYSCFLSPLKFNGSIGMDFKVKKDKKYDVSVALLPLSYNMVYVGNSDVDVTQFGIEANRRVLHRYGSKLQVDHTLYILPQITWKSYFYIFSSYENTEGQWENTFDFAVNKFLSAKVFVNARFDDSVSRSNNESYFQFQELLSFGLSYNL